MNQKVTIYKNVICFDFVRFLKCCKKLNIILRQIISKIAKMSLRFQRIDNFFITIMLFLGGYDFKKELIFFSPIRHLSMICIIFSNLL